MDYKVKGQAVRGEKVAEVCVPHKSGDAGVGSGELTDGQVPLVYEHEAGDAEAGKAARFLAPAGTAVKAGDYRVRIGGVEGWMDGALFEALVAG